MHRNRHRNSIFIWETSPWKEKLTLGLPLPDDQDEWIENIAISAAGKLAAIFTKGGRDTPSLLDDAIRVWDLHTGTQIGRYFFDFWKLDFSPANSVVFSTKVDPSLSDDFEYLVYRAGRIPFWSASQCSHSDGVSQSTKIVYMWAWEGDEWFMGLGNFFGSLRHISLRLQLWKVRHLFSATSLVRSRS
jgi:hypothetical protein